MLIRFLNHILILVALASGSFPVVAVPQIALNGEVENNGGRVCLTVTNNSDQPFDGIAVIALGSDTDLAEIGEFAFRIEARSSAYFRIRSRSVSGSFYRLRILSPAGSLLLYRTAPIRQATDSSQAIEVDLSPPRGKSPATNQGIPAETRAPVEQPAPESQEVSVRPQLLGTPADPASYAIFFELRARQPVLKAKMSIRAGKFSDGKPVSIAPSATLQFQLPGKESDAGYYEQIEYSLTDANGRELASGSVELDQLMDDDAITVLDVRTHRPSYAIGETVKLTVMLEGRSPKGYRLEVLMRDYNGLKMFVDQRSGDGQSALTPQEFVFILPTEARKPLIFEYKVFNPESGLLFDSGEFEIPVEDKSF